MNTQSNEAPQKENKSPENKLKNMEICNISVRKFKISVWKKLSEIQESTER